MSKSFLRDSSHRPVSSQVYCQHLADIHVRDGALLSSMPPRSILDKMTSLMPKEADLREREIQRVLHAYEASFGSAIWEDIWNAPSKSNVDIIAQVLRANYEKVSPRCYESFDDLDFRDAICRRLGKPYDELPNVGPEKKDLSWTLAVWWWGAVGAVAVSAIAVALVRSVLGKS